MSNSKKIAVVAVAAAIAVPASAWWMGRTIEATYDEQYRQIAELPYLNIVSRDYQRGLFSATEQVTLELSEEWVRGLLLAQDNVDPDLLDEAAAVRFTLKTHVKHGPLPGWSTFGAGEADVTLVLDESLRERATELFGNKSPLSAHVKFRFDGGGVASMTSPAFEYAKTDDASGEASSVSWGGAHMILEFSRDMAEYTMQFDLPRLELKAGNGHVLFSDLSMAGDQHRPFDDENMFYVGNVKLSLGHLRVAGMESEDDFGDVVTSEPLEIARVVYDIAMPMRGDYVDLSAKFAADQFQVGEQDYGPVHYDFSLNRLHARTVAKLYRTLMESYYDPELQAAAAYDPSVLFAPMTEPAVSLLAYNPELSLDRISFNSAHGTASLSARARFDNLQPEEVGNPFALMFKLDASGELSLPLGLIGDIQKNAAGSEEEAAEMTMMFEQQLEQFVQQGYVQRDGDRLSTRIAFKGGELTVNDKPFNPLALGVQ
ncbi:MAG: YdgA family protein [Rhodocyclaceae bacterium]